MDSNPRAGVGQPDVRHGRFRHAVGVAVALLLFATACGGNDNGTAGEERPTTEEPFKLAVIYPFEIMDGGYAQVHHEALFRAIESLGEEKFEVKEVDSVPYTDQLTQTAVQLLQTHDALLEFNASGPLVYEACKQVPDKKCLLIYPSGFPPTSELPSNAGAFFYDAESLFYVEGVAAGKITKTGTLGFLASFEAPFAIARINAFLLGCQSVLPSCKLRVVYMNTFNDPPKETQATNSLMDAGADVIAHEMDTPASLIAAQERGKVGFGLYRREQAEAAPEATLTVIELVDALERIYTDELGSMLDGSWMPGRLVMGDVNTGVKLSPWNERTPQDAIDAAEAALEEIKAGTNPFTGPIRDAKGKLRVPEGDELDPKRIQWMWDWPVQGVIGG